ncbi:MAG: HNH endonuclease, partial [Bifidobacteriaceae bacterium]|nr:HNH endonuclease [Bifidobacteriaceae bacterium]
PPEVCECHHVVPWKQGGDTKLSNLCLLCPAHHRLVEPPKGRDPDWVLGLREDGLWEFRPPAWYDPERTPLMHHRHRKPPHPAATEASADGPAGDGADGRESGGSGRREDGDQPGDPPNDS